VNQTDAELQSDTSVSEEQRKEPRFPSDLSAILTTLETGKVVEARTVDISKSGLRLRAPGPVDQGERLRIQFGGSIAFGDARWCRDLKGAGYDVGIRVEHTLDESLVESIHKALERVRNGG